MLWKTAFVLCCGLCGLLMASPALAEEKASVDEVLATSRDMSESRAAMERLAKLASQFKGIITQLRQA